MEIVASAIQKSYWEVEDVADMVIVYSIDNVNTGDKVVSKADPAVTVVLLEATNPGVSESTVYVAGDLVTDPLCKPFSMGRNLLCVYSKKHMYDVPELAEMKNRPNTRSLKEMALPPT